MSTAAVFNQLGQTVMPTVFAAVFPDTMTVQGETAASDSGGGRVKAARTDVYTNVPVMYEPMQIENRSASGDKLVSFQQYKLTFPAYQSGVRLDIDPKAHRFLVGARGDEPEKVFKMVALRDLSGLLFEAICTKEN